MSLPDAAPLHAFLFADPAAHSLSPRMHAAAFQAAGLHGVYEARRVSSPELPAALASLRRPGVLGANLSLPHKEAALPLLESLSPAARAIGAVNTVIHRDGTLHGDNTDALGLLWALHDLGVGSAGDPSVDGSVVVLGAGGAARAAVYTALILLKRNVYIVNRTRSRAEDLAAAWNEPGADVQVQAADPSGVLWPTVSLVINASSAGLDAPDQTPLDPAWLSSLPPHALVYDMVYKPAHTRLMREAHALGLRAENGLGMLAHQARLAFTAWTGAEVPAQVFLDALPPAGGPS